MKKIAVTGGLAAGKTSVCRILQNLGAYVISADTIVHRLLSPSSEIYSKVINLLGSDILDGQRIDRDKVAQKVFRDAHKLQQLEALLHPAVRKEIEINYQQVQQNNPPFLFVAEIPLLFESANEDFFDAVVAVVAPEPICRARFFASTGYGEDEFTVRSKRQMSAEEKAAKADYVIINDDSSIVLEQKVKALYETLVTQA